MVLDLYAGPQIMNSKMEYTRCGIPKLETKMGNKQPDEDKDIKREKDIRKEIEMLYKGEKKRSQNDAEIEVNMVKEVVKKKKLDNDGVSMLDETHNSQFVPATIVVKKLDYNVGASINEAHNRQFSPADSSDISIIDRNIEGGGY